MKLDLTAGEMFVVTTALMDQKDVLLHEGGRDEPVAVLGTVLDRIEALLIEELRAGEQN